MAPAFSLLSRRAFDTLTNCVGITTTRFEGTDRSWVRRDSSGRTRADRHRTRMESDDPCAAGVLTVLTAAARWTVPVGRAVWIPAGMPVEIDNARPVRVRIVYLQRNPAAVAEPFPADRPTVVSLSPFACELLAHIVRQAPLKPGDPLHSAS